jgi:hypothetical protein
MPSSVTARLLRLATTICCIACAAAPAQTQPAAPPAEGDTTIFALVVKAAVAEAGVPARVDPRPLRAESYITDANGETRARVSEGTIAARERVLRRLGVEVTDDPTRGKCPGALLIAPPGTPPFDMAALCPKEPQARLAIGLERRGVADVKMGRIEDRRTGVEPGDWSVRVLLTWLTPRGATTTVYDFVFHWDQGAWTFVKSVPLLAID